MRVSYPNKYQCIVGQPFLLNVDLSDAMPTREDMPDATLVVSVLANAPNESRQKDEALVVWSAKQVIPAGSKQTAIELGPLSVAGDQQLSVTLDGQHVRESPKPIHVLPGPPAPSATELCGGPTGIRVIATAGEPACFFILLRDACGNRCAGGLKAHTANLQIHVSLRPISGSAADGIGSSAPNAARASDASAGPNGQVSSASQLALRSGEGIIPAEEPSQGLRIDPPDAEGAVAVHFMRHRAGEYEALVHIGSHRIMPQLSVEVRAGPASPQHCHAEGTALEEAVCNREMRFTMITHDAHGNRRAKGADAITAHLLLRDPLAGSRWGEGVEATVNAATAAYGDRPSLKGWGAPGMGGYSAAGADAYRKPHPGAREAMTFVTRAAITGIDQPTGGKVRVTVADEGDGAYRCSFLLLHAGEYALHVLVHGKHIAGSPFSCSALPSYLAPTASTASGPGLKHGIAGEASVFHVTPRDKSGTLVATGDHLSQISVRVVHRESSAHAQVWVRAGADGALDIYHRSLRIGPHDVWVLLNNNTLPGCPHHLTITAASVCPEACTITGLPLLSAPHKPPPLHFKPHAQLDAQKQTRSPYEHEEPLRIPPLSAPFPFAVPPPLEVEAHAGVACHCQLTVRDKFGNARAPPTSQLTARLIRDGDGERADVTIQRANPHHSAGQHAAEFLVDFTPRTAGWHDLRCSDTTGAAAAVVRVHVRASSAVSCALVPGTALVGTPLLSAQWISFDLTPSDALGNPLENFIHVRDAPLPVVTSATIADSHPAQVMRHDDGKFGGWTVQLMPAYAGSHDLHISIANVPAAGSPFVLDVRPGLVHAKRCTASGEGLRDTMPLRPSVLTIEARDIFGNQCFHGGQTFNVAIAPRAHGHYGTIDRVVDNDDGTHSVHYTCAVSGTYSVQISLGRAPIEGSPYPLTCWAEDDFRAPPHPVTKAHTPSHLALSPAKRAGSAHTGRGVFGGPGSPKPHGVGALVPYTGASPRSSVRSELYSDVSSRYMLPSPRASPRAASPARATPAPTTRTTAADRSQSPRRSASTPYLAGYSPRYHETRHPQPPYDRRPAPQPWETHSTMAASSQGEAPTSGVIPRSEKPSEKPRSLQRPSAVQPPPSPHVYHSPRFRGPVGIQ